MAVHVPLPNPSFSSLQILANYNILRHTRIQSIDRTQPCLGKKKKQARFPVNWNWIGVATCPCTVISSFVIANGGPNTP